MLAIRIPVPRYPESQRADRVRREMQIGTLLPMHQPHLLILAKCGVKVTGGNTLTGYFCGQC